MLLHTLTRLASCALLCFAGAAMGAAPAWLREAASAPQPKVGPEMDAVQLLSDVELVVTPDGKMHKRIRGVVRILRQEGRGRAIVRAPQDSWNSVKDMSAWLLPAGGKPEEKRLKDATEILEIDAAGGEVMTDHRMKELRFPEAQPGAVFGYQYEIEQSPLEQADTFAFQSTIPVREARYSLKLPPGWSMLPTWLNHAPLEPASQGSQQWQWSLRDVPAVPVESYMPAWWSVAGHLFVSFSQQGKTPQLSTWAGIGGWFVELSKDRRAATDAMRARVAALVSGASTDVDKMRVLADFVQREVRYVSIQLGIGGYQPHAAADVFQHRYGDCKDKATLLSVLLAEVGIESMPVIVNSQRTRVRADMPPSLQFDHVILAIRLPAGNPDNALPASMDDGGQRLLFFDPTDELTPFGRIRGELQGSIGLLALADNSRLVKLPQLQPEQSGVRRTAKLALSEQGVLTGEVKERITGQEALMQRGFMRATRREADTNKVVEARLAESLASFQLVGAALRNREVSELPLEWDYRISAASYARRSGDLLMVRPRVLGVHAVTLPDQEKPRVHDLILSEPRRHQDEVIMDLPAGYAAESLPQPVELDVGFAVYRSRTEVHGAQLKYVRSYEVRELLVPAERIADFHRLHREMARDEKAVVVLKKAGP